MYTFEQYEKFFDMFEGNNAGLIYKPRTFASERLFAVLHSILNNMLPDKKVDEEKIKEDLIKNPKLGKHFVDFIYGDLAILNATIAKIQDHYVPDFLDAIQLWRTSL
jgi:hypothetical protein